MDITKEIINKLEDPKQNTKSFLKSEVTPGQEIDWKVPKYA